LLHGLSGADVRHGQLKCIARFAAEDDAATIAAMLDCVGNEFVDYQCEWKRHVDRHIGWGKVEFDVRTSEGLSQVPAQIAEEGGEGNRAQIVVSVEPLMNRSNR
jgi:hypothetical protein